MGELNMPFYLKCLPKKELDGQSITSFFSTGAVTRSKPLLWSFYNALNQHVIAMRSGDCKIMARLKNDDGYLPKILNVHRGNEALVKNATLTDFELYNLKQDVGETQDLSTKKPEVLERLKKELTQEYTALLNDSHIWERQQGSK